MDITRGSSPPVSPEVTLRTSSGRTSLIVETRSAFDVAVGDDSVFVVGASTIRHFILRAYDALSGTTRWESIVGAGVNAVASGVTVDGDTVLVSGVVLSNWLVRAHDAENRTSALGGPL
jgi:hypothetical protein